MWRGFRPFAAACVALALLGGAYAFVLAQVSGDRGIAPTASSSDIGVRGINVGVTGKNAEDARQSGWRQAQRLAKSLGVELDAEGESPTLTVSVHVQNVGDRSFGAGEYAGTRGQSLGIEGFSVALAQPIAGLELEYMAHVAGKGDLPWVRAGEYAGTRGESRSVEGFAMRLVGSAAASYALTYSAHVQNVGDVPEQSDGGYCGTRGRGLKVEGLTVSLRKQ